MGKKAFKSRSFLAQNIIARRETLGWNQLDLAHKVGVHVNIIKKIETDKGEGEPETRQAIAQALGCTMSDLYREAVKRAIPDVSSAIDFLGKFAGLSPELQGLVSAIVYGDASLAPDTPIRKDSFLYQIVSKLR